MKGMKTLMNETGKIANLNLVALAAAIALALAFGPALAATIVVPTTSNPEIQDGIDAADPGDTVKLKKSCGSGATCGVSGQYHQSVEIDKELTLNCSGATLDGDVPSGKSGSIDGAAPLAGPVRLVDDGVDILSTGGGTTIVNCTIMNFGVDGIDSTSGAAGITIRNNTLINNEDHGVELDGDDFLIERNVATENDGDGFRTFQVNDGIIRRNVARGNNGAGINVKGDRVKILNNRAFQNDDDGFDIDGDAVGSFTIIGNRSEVNGNFGFDIDQADDSTISRNLARANGDDGFEAFGSNIIIERNVALFNGDSSSDHGFDLSSGTIENAIITRNVSIGNSGDGFVIDDDENTVTLNRAMFNRGEGFDISCGDPGVPGCGPIMHNRAIGNTNAGFKLDNIDKATVSHNKALRNEDNGFEIDDADTTTFINNLARDNGGVGFDVFRGDKSTFELNKSIRNDKDGFEIGSDGDEDITLTKNTAKNNSEDGFDINNDFGTVTMVGNKAIRNANTGIENDAGADTTLTDNIMRGNGIDLAGRGDEGTTGGPCNDTPGEATDGGGNVFATGGFDTCVPDKSDD